MLKRKLHWRRPVFYLLLPIMLVMVFLGFPMPVSPPPATKPAVEASMPVRRRRRRRDGGA